MVTVEEVEDIAAFASFSFANNAAPSTPAPTPVAAPTTPVSATPTPSLIPRNDNVPTEGITGRVFASPLARKKAREAQASIESIYQVLGGKGSGSNNRVVSADVTKGLTLLASVPSTPAITSSSTTPSTAASASLPSKPTFKEPQKFAYTTNQLPHADFELSETARHLANRLSLNKQTVPHYYVSVEINLSQLLKVREQFNQQLGVSTKKSAESNFGLGVLDFLVKAAAQAVRQVPDVNASWMETFVRRYDQVDVNLVVGSGSSLATPVIRNVGEKGLLSIADEIRQFENSLFSNDQSVVDGFLQDESKQAIGTLTIHNLGAYGVKAAAPIVMLPQACALAFGAIQETVVPRKTGENEGKAWEIAPVMVATMSCDHRVVDGAVSAQYLSAFKQLVENPLNLLL